MLGPLSGLGGWWAPARAGRRAPAPPLRKAWPHAAAKGKGVPKARAHATAAPAKEEVEQLLRVNAPLKVGVGPGPGGKGGEAAATASRPIGLQAKAVIVPPLLRVRQDGKRAADGLEGLVRARGPTLVGVELEGKLPRVWGVGGV